MKYRIILSYFFAAIFTLRMNAQSVPANDRDLEQMIYYTERLATAVENWRSEDCLSFNCREMQDLHYSLRNMMQTIKYLKFWLRRAGQEPGMNPNRIYQRIQKAGDAYNKLANFIIAAQPYEGTLTHWLVKYNSTNCHLDLNYIATATVPVAYSVENFETITTNDKSKNWAEALNYFNDKISDSRVELQTLPTVRKIKPVVRLTKAKWNAGESMTANFRAPVCYPVQSWVGIVKEDVAHNNRELNARSTIGGKSFLNGRQEGTMSFRAPEKPGRYELRMYNIETGEEVASTWFTVNNNTTPAPAVVNNNSPWTMSASRFRNQIGQRFTFHFGPGRSKVGVWGTDLYTDDTPIAMAAVHAGLITFEQGGTVTIEIRPAGKNYVGTTRNGIKSISYHSWFGSYVFVR